MSNGGSTAQGQVTHTLALTLALTLSFFFLLYTSTHILKFTDTHTYILTQTYIITHTHTFLHTHTRIHTIPQMGTAAKLSFYPYI